jgi:hypothetical protein
LKKWARKEKNEQQMDKDSSTIDFCDGVCQRNNQISLCAAIHPHQCSLVESVEPCLWYGFHVMAATANNHIKESTAQHDTPTSTNVSTSPATTTATTTSEAKEEEKGVDNTKKKMTRGEKRNARRANQKERKQKTKKAKTAANLNSSHTNLTNDTNISTSTSSDPPVPMSNAKRIAMEKKKQQLVQQKAKKHSSTNSNDSSTVIVAGNGRAVDRKGKSIDGDDDEELAPSLSYVDSESLRETDYYLNINDGLRHVYPYYYSFKSHVKNRWRGITVLDMYTREFVAYPSSYYRRAIDDGRILVRDKRVNHDYILCEGDWVTHRVHRHELPVSGQPIGIIYKDDHVIVVDKPSSIPVHPVGAFRHNTLAFIIAKKYNVQPHGMFIFSRA